MPDTSLFSGARALWYVTPPSVSEVSIGAVIASIKARAPNVNALFVKCWNGPSWANFALASKPGMAVTGQDAVRRWADALHAANMKMIAWGVATGTNTAQEAAVMRAVAAAGPDALVVDVESGPYYFTGTSAAATYLAQTAASTGVHVGLCLDYRGTHPAASKAVNWYPFAHSLHPMAYHFHFGRSAASVMAEMSATLAPLNKPIVPALQGYSVGTRLYNPDDIPTTADVALKSPGVVGLSWFRYGVGLHLPESGIGPNDLWAVAKVAGAGAPKVEPIPVPPSVNTWQDFINATKAASVALRYPEAQWWSWLMVRAGIDSAALAKRKQPYDGPAIGDLNWSAKEIAAYRAAGGKG